MNTSDTAVIEHPLRSVELKIDRGEMLARNLTQSIMDWLARSPPTARADFAADRHGYRLILEQFKEPPLSDEWGLLIGDCVHNLRSALDNLCFALAIQRCDPPSDPRGIYFPVSGNADTFARSAKSTLEQVSQPGSRRLLEAVAAIQPRCKGRHSPRCTQFA
jgi:hypothetical protein